MDIGLSTRGIEAKAVVLWDRATALSRKCPDTQRAPAFLPENKLEITNG